MENKQSMIDNIEIDEKISLGSHHTNTDNPDELSSENIQYINDLIKESQINAEEAKKKSAKWNFIAKILNLILIILLSSTGGLSINSLFQFNENYELNTINIFVAIMITIATILSGIYQTLQPENVKLQHSKKYFSYLNFSRSTRAKLNNFHKKIHEREFVMDIQHQYSGLELSANFN